MSDSKFLGTGSISHGRRCFCLSVAASRPSAASSCACKNSSRFQDGVDCKAIKGIYCHRVPDVRARCVQAISLGHCPDCQDEEKSSWCRRKVSWRGGSGTTG